MVKLFVCGDLVHAAPDSGFIGIRLTDVIAESDYAICNLEGCELSHGLLPKKSYPYQSEGTVKYLKEVGFDMLLLANNHITDYGKDGLVNTIGIIDDCGLDRIGAGTDFEEAYKPCIRVINGKNNLCEAQVGQYENKQADCGYAWMGNRDVFKNVCELSQLTDWTVVLVHAGLEHYELPLPEIRNYYRRLCDSGASCVIGGHPHIAQGYEFYNDKFIAYSLGNFYFPHAEGVYPRENHSYSLQITLSKNDPISVKPIFHSLNNGVVEVEHQTPVDIEHLCSALGTDYDRLVNKQCVEAYKHLCGNLIAAATCGEILGNRSLTYHIKNILKRTLFRHKYLDSTQEERRRLLLRLFENETYRWTIIRALKQMVQ